MRFLLPFRPEPERRATEAQIEEARRLAAEVGEVRDQLVARANGALYKLKGAAKDVTGESKG